MAKSRPVVAWIREETVERMDKAVADDPAAYRSRSHFVDAAVCSVLDEIEKKSQPAKRKRA